MSQNNTEAAVDIVVRELIDDATNTWSERLVLTIYPTKQQKTLIPEICAFLNDRYGDYDCAFTTRRTKEKTGATASTITPEERAEWREKHTAEPIYYGHRIVRLLDALEAVEALVEEEDLLDNYECIEEEEESIEAFVGGYYGIPLCREIDGKYFFVLEDWDGESVTEVSKEFYLAWCKEFEEIQDAVRNSH